MKTTIYITAKHIREGKQYDCETCPIALAMAEALGLPTKHIAVGAVTVTVLVLPPVRNQAHGPRYDKLGELPKEATAFVGSFDKKGGGAVEPFQFDFEYNSTVLETARRVYLENN